MTLPQSIRLPGFAATLVLGLGVGYFAATARVPSVRATISNHGGGDRYGESAVLTVAVAQEYDERTKVQAPQDALIVLDYRAGRLLATIPTLKQSVNGTQVIDGFAERDLANDFHLGEGGAPPHFVLTAGSLGVKGATWSPLFVFETVSRQVGVYRVQPQASGKKIQPKFDLLEVKTYLGEPSLPELPSDSTTPSKADR